MTQEEKQLLLIDLCDRLPYHLQCYCKWIDKAPNGTSGCVQELSTFVIDEIEIMDDPQFKCQICDVKPYLRPMSSMTEEEVKELSYKILQQPDLESVKSNNFDMNSEEAFRYIDWLNKHHFDYRGLIPMGLAIEVTEKNNPYKNNKL